MEDSSGFCAAHSVVWAFEEVVGFGMMLLVAEVSRVVATRYSGGVGSGSNTFAGGDATLGERNGLVEFVKRREASLRQSGDAFGVACFWHA
jgi:hypothetical protein